jgi:adenine deaminase
MSENTEKAEVQGVKQEPGTEPDINVSDNVPRFRLNEVIAKNKALEDKIFKLSEIAEEQKRAELEEQGKVSELNTQLKSEVKGLKQYKKMFEEQDGKIRTDALNKLPEDKRDKFKDLKTGHLLDVVDELTDKIKAANPPDNVGVVKKELPEGNIFSMDSGKRKSFWNDYLESKSNQ